MKLLFYRTDLVPSHPSRGKSSGRRPPGWIGQRLRLRLPRQRVRALRPLLRAARDGGRADVRGERSAGAEAERRGGPLGSRSPEGPLRAGRAAGDAGLALRRGGHLLQGGQGRDVHDWPGGYYTYEDPETSAVAGTYDVALYPEGRAGRFIYSGCHTFAIPATVRDRPAAIQLLRFLTSRESQAFEAGLGTLPARSDSLGTPGRRPLPVRWRSGGGVCWRRRRRRLSSRPNTRTTPRWRTPSGRASARPSWARM